MSAPVFVTAGFVVRPSAENDWMGEMLPSTDFSPSHSKVGIVWESYGITARDTTTIALAVGRSDGSSVLQRLGRIVGMNVDARGSLSMSWTETDAPPSIAGVGNIPVQLRAVSLDFRDLLPGEYALQISMRRQDGSEVHARRTFRVLK